MLRISTSPIATVILPGLFGDTVKASFSEGSGGGGCNGQGTGASICNRCEQAFPWIGLSLAGRLSVPLSVSVGLQVDSLWA